MKKFVIGLLLVFCFVSVAHANEPAEVSILRKASGENWEGFRKGIESLITVNSDGKEIFPTEVLGRLAFKFAVENKHLNLVSEQYRNEASYMNVFSIYNKLGATITVDDFRRIGQAGGIRLPIERDPVTKKFVPFASDSVPVAVVAETNQVVSGSDKVPVETNDLNQINESLKASQTEIKDLQARLKKLSVDNANVAQLKGKIGEVETQLTKALSNLNELSAGQKKMSSDQSKIAESMKSELATIQTTMAKINAIESEMEAKLGELDSEDSKLWEGLNKINDYYFVVTTSVIALIVVIMLYLGWERRRVSKIALTVKNVEIEVDGIKTKLTNLEFDHHAVSNTTLKSMDYDIENEVLVRNVSSGANYVVGITRESEFIFSISGINRRPHDSGVQKIDIRKTNVRNMIINAGEPLRFCRVSPEIVISEKEKQAA